MATIRLYRRAGVVYCDFQVSGLPRVRRSTGARDETTAMRNARAMLQAAEAQARTIQSRSMTAAATRWLEGHVTDRRNVAGQHMATQRVTDWILPVIGKLQPGAVTFDHARAIRRRCEAGKLGPQTVVHVLRDFACLMRHSGNRLDVGPAMPKVPERAVDRLTDDHAAQIVNALPESFPVRIALATGMRFAEIRALTWPMFVEAPAAHFLFTTPKTGRVRRVPILPPMIDELRARRQLGGDWISPYRSTNAGSLVAVTTRRGIQPWHFHQLRHTFACRWLDAGGSLPALQAILGHSTVRLTERYAKLSDRAMFAEADRVGTITGTVETEVKQDNDLQEKR